MGVEITHKIPRHRQIDRQVADDFQIADNAIDEKYFGYDLNK